MHEFEGVGHSDCTGFSDCFDAAVVIQCRCEVPGSGGVVAPSLATGRLDMYHDFGANWGHWGSVKGEHAFPGSVGRE